MQKKYNLETKVDNRNFLERWNDDMQEWLKSDWGQAMQRGMEVLNSAMASVMQQLYDEARALSGEVSGEHGIGHAKKAFLRDSVGERQIALMRGIKAVFDPNGILNPGKVAAE